MSENKAALKRLEVLVGRWQLLVIMPTDPPMRIAGRATFEWLPGNAFLVYRSEVENPNFPKGESIIGCDDQLETYSMLYSDSRGFSRLYSMSLNDNVWKLWRDDPNFSQRFTSTLSADGTTLTGQWEKSFDGIHWEHDFDLNATRV
jgi:hypothetical protein